MSELHLPWLSLFHTCTISPQLTFDASSWLHIKLIYGAIPFNTVSDSSSDIFSLKYCLFLLQCISFSGYLGKQLKNCYPYCFRSSRSSSKVLFSTPPPPPIYFFFLSVALRNWLLYPLRLWFYIVSSRQCYIRTMLYPCYLNAFLIEENYSRKAKTITGSNFGPTSIVGWFFSAALVTSLQHSPSLHL